MSTNSSKSQYRGILTPLEILSKSMHFGVFWCTLTFSELDYFGCGVTSLLSSLGHGTPMLLSKIIKKYLCSFLCSEIPP